MISLAKLKETDYGFLSLLASLNKLKPTLYVGPDGLLHGILSKN